MWQAAHLNELGGGVHVVPHAQLPGSLLPNGQLIACDHLHLDALLQAPLHRFARVVPGGVEQRQQRHKLPLRLRH